ncbi:MAG: hypothetical protein KTR31_07960 [Myxococcales bacterium]|nr:hypothetical protein [Myxococcales bacterium]
MAWTVDMIVEQLEQCITRSEAAGQTSTIRHLALTELVELLPDVASKLAEMDDLPATTENCRRREALTKRMNELRLEAQHYLGPA